MRVPANVYVCFVILINRYTINYNSNTLYIDSCVCGIVWIDSVDRWMDGSIDR